MKLEITRSFSKTIQVKQYEPVNFFCAVKIELDVKSASTKTLEAYSKDLDDLVQREVEKSIENNPDVALLRGKKRLRKEAVEKHFEPRDFEEDESK